MTQERLEAIVRWEMDHLDGKNPKPLDPLISIDELKLVVVKLWNAAGFNYITNAGKD